MSKNTPDNLKLFAEIWPGIIAHAEKHNVRVCIENCPMYFTNDEWPNGQNLATSPEIWREMFSVIKSDCFGLAYDPSHLVLQRMDYIRPIYDFADKMFYVHLKDAKFYQDKMDQCGMFAPPLSYHSPKLPGLGDINWGAFLSALYDIRFDGYACIEIEDKAFEKTLEDRKTAAILSKRYLNQFMV
jgi:sugar phosphate isomerase/epimerase